MEVHVTLLPQQVFVFSIREKNIKMALGLDCFETHPSKNVLDSAETLMPSRFVAPVVI